MWWYWLCSRKRDDIKNYLKYDNKWENITVENVRKEKKLWEGTLSWLSNTE
jgi:hypothetical protein